MHYTDKNISSFCSDYSLFQNCNANAYQEVQNGGPATSIVMGASTLLVSVIYREK